MTLGSPLRWLLLAWLWLAIPAWAQSLAAIPALDSPVVDTTGTLDAGQEQQLVQQALALQQRKGSQLQILLVPTTGPESIEQYSQRVFDQWKLGRQGVDDGLLLLVAKDDRKVRIQPGYGLEGAIPDAIANRVIQEYLVPHFRQGDYGGGILAATAVLVKLIDGEQLPAPMADNPGPDAGRDWVMAVFAAFMVAQVVRVFFRGVPRLPRSLLAGGLAGGAAWLVSSMLVFGLFGGVLGFLIGLVTPGSGGGRYARHGGWGGYGGGGGGGWGGGSSGGGGWSGGGGMSGGGGASGSW